MDILSELRGIGPATASAIVAVYNPGEPFFSDEATLAVGLGTPKYTAKFYEQFKSLMIGKLGSSDAFATMEDLEKACWAKSVLETNGEIKAAFDERERTKLYANGKRKWDHNAHKKAGRGKKAKKMFEAKQSAEAKKAGGSGAKNVQVPKKEASAAEGKAPAAKKKKKEDGAAGNAPTQKVQKEAGAAGPSQKPAKAAEATEKKRKTRSG